jgi:hypothetical protein
MNYLLYSNECGVEHFGVTLPQQEDGRWPVLWSDGRKYVYFNPASRFDFVKKVREVNEQEILAWRLKHGA